MTNRERAPEAVCARTRFDWQAPPLETVTTGTFGLWCANRLPAAATLNGPPGRPVGDVVNAVPRGALRQPPLSPCRTETMDHMHINPSDARDVLDAREVLGYYDHDGDCEGSDFKRHLITAIICAGPEDRARLALGFPSLVAAIKSQTSNPASIEYLEGIARSYERPSGQGR